MKNVFLNPPLLILVLSLSLVACGKNFEVRSSSELAKLDKNSPTEKLTDEAGLAPVMPPQYEKISDDFVRYRTQKPVAERFFFTKETEVENETETQLRRVRGGLDIKDFKHEFDKKTRKMRITGELHFANEKDQQKIPFVMSGVLDKESTIKDSIQLAVETGPEGLRESLQGTVFCASESCEDFFIEFHYLASNHVLYEEKFIPTKLFFESPTAKPDPAMPQAAPPAEEVLEVVEDGGVGFVPAPFVGSSDQEIIERFPKLREERKKAEEKVKTQKAQKQTPAPTQQNTPQAVPGAPVTPPAKPPQERDGRPAEIEPLWPDTRAYPESVNKILRPLIEGENQAYGPPSRGRLANGVNLIPLAEALGEISGFQIMQPQRRISFGTSELVSMVIKIGQWIYNRFGPSFKLDVRNMSAEKGGRLAGHDSHQNGLDADIGYIFDETNTSGQMQRATHPNGKVKDTFQVDKQWELFKALIKSDRVQFLLVSKTVKRALCQHVQKVETGEALEEAQQILKRISDRFANHDNHFHMRVKCGPKQRFCVPLDIGNEPACPKTK